MTAAAIRITLNAQIFSCQEPARRYAEFAETLLQAFQPTPYLQPDKNPRVYPKWSNDYICVVYRSLGIYIVSIVSSSANDYDGR